MFAWRAWDEKIGAKGNAVMVTIFGRWELLNNHRSLLHDKYVIVSADKAPNNIVIVCKSHYIDCLINELGIDNSLGNPTYTTTTFTKEELLDNHRSVLCFFGISTKDEEQDLPSLYWIPKLHKCLIVAPRNLFPIY